MFARIRSVSIARPLIALRTALKALPELRSSAASAFAPLIEQLVQTIGEHRDEYALLQRAIDESPPHYLREGGVIAAGNPFFSAACCCAEEGVLGAGAGVCTGSSPHAAGFRALRTG